MRRDDPISRFDQRSLVDLEDLRNTLVTTDCWQTGLDRIHALDLIDVGGIDGRSKELSTLSAHACKKKKKKKKKKKHLHKHVIV